mmetsp:Transcript_113122/g.241449  ORF Transcript_113122/g.241449 Transcript_113122/m.241449 type:complete len:204 (+) Transcript_113122:605-1216(+)
MAASGLKAGTGGQRPPSLLAAPRPPSAAISSTPPACTAAPGCAAGGCNASAAAATSPGQAIWAERRCAFFTAPTAATTPALPTAAVRALPSRAAVAGATPDGAAWALARSLSLSFSWRSRSLLSSCSLACSAARKDFGFATSSRFPPAASLPKASVPADLASARSPSGPRIPAWMKVLGPPAPTKFGKAPLAAEPPAVVVAAG